MTVPYINEDVIPSGYDPRDYTVSAAYEAADVELPEEYEVWQPPTENQLSTGNCVAQSIANVMECMRYKRTGEHHDYSVGFVYGNRRNKYQVDSKGMKTRYAIASMTEQGDIFRSFITSQQVNWETWEVPDVIEKFELQYDRFADFADKIQAYVQLRTGREIKEFIYKYKLPVIVTGDTAKLFGIDSYTGTHAVVCYGWKGLKLKIHNSWGKRHEYTLVDFYDTNERWGLIPMEKEFTDIQDERWSAEAINEAAYDGIIMGYPDGTFKPEQSLSREEMAVIYQRIKRQITKMIGESIKLK